MSATEPTAVQARRLRNMSEIRTFFRTNETPVFFLGATAFNLLGMDRWVRNFSMIAYFDSWDGYHPRVFVPPEIEHEEFTSGEDINNYLLRHPDVRAHIDAAAERTGRRPKTRRSSTTKRPNRSARNPAGTSSIPHMSCGTTSTPKSPRHGSATRLARRACPTS